MLNNFNLLPLTIEHVEKRNPSLKIYLQTIGLKEKLKQVEQQKLNSKVNMLKVKIENVKKGSTSNIQNFGLDLHLEVPKISYLLLDPIIHNLKCCVKELQVN
jgi:hypothetical protein